ncbi:hypothetical protein [Paenarthrobacter ureafaciens]|uniref:hypothetical protein n=1 Tax=Paenarthrobacter ureafaciens TaxID=37931 RepID=UPI001D17CB7E|nr:hypothetical protein [Paenarthrobacter ureafaciens]GLU61574.1 hypothetical protein Pure01_40870 [Paenarthrobacter ureafaciens]GLU65847.1 hypothetical protein Pure02_40970 [Paenarthrobacter ureafaciens]GLU70161.1 hypothetical protein Pure03_41370 [Paenarthrobacter ureafaciens]GLU74403.1 hypothetical protein Pure04_41180 [Paenarthrobacter ureafaciens]GLU78643.1 hypothetical protein Pure05_40830 [Paenarthrobacter ureafaciens]
MSKPQEIDARGRWVVLDRTPEGTSLLAIGTEDYPGISPRNWLDARTKIVLVDKLKAILSSGETFHEVVRYGSAEFAVTAKPIISPDGQMIVGAYGIFDHPGHKLPDEPLLGTWQWRVSKTTGKNVGEDSSRWNENLFKIYGIDPTTVESQRGPAGEWLAKLISTKDRDTIKLVIDSGISVNNRSRHLLSYEIIYGYGSANPGKKQIAMSARAYDDPDYPDAIMLRGFSREVASPTKVVTPGLSPVSSGLVAEALFALAADRAFAAIDMQTEVTFRTSAKWADFGLLPDFEGNLAALAHPDDKFAFEHHLASVAAGRIGPESSTDVRLRTSAETWKQFSVAVAPIDSADGESRYLMTSLVPVGRQA